MTTQPDALLLADALDVITTAGVVPEAASELRRLHEEITQLRHGAGVANQTIADLVAQRDQLLTALKALLPVLDKVWDFDDDVFGYLHNDAVDADARARAAIRDVEAVEE